MAEHQRDRGYSHLEETEAKPLATENGSPNLSYRGDREPLQVKKPSLFKRILRWRKYIILILTPILLMPIPIAVKGTVSWSRQFYIRLATVSEKGHRINFLFKLCTCIVVY